MNPAKYLLITHCTHYCVSVHVTDLWHRRCARVQAMGLLPSARQQLAACSTSLPCLASTGHMASLGLYAMPCRGPTHSCHSFAALACAEAQGQPRTASCRQATRKHRWAKVKVRPCGLTRHLTIG
jgi:hypothetical protein